MQPVRRDTHGHPPPTRDFPTPIRDALSRIAGRVGRCAELGATARLLLAELVRCVGYKTPEVPFRVGNDALAAALGASVRSVGRLKLELEMAGWIGRRQVKSRRRGMQVADHWLTPLALDALGLGGPAVDNRRGTYPQATPKRRPTASDAFQTLPQSPSERRPAPTGPGNGEEPEDKESSPEQPALSEAELEVLRELQAQYGDDLALMDAEEQGGLPPTIEEQLSPQVAGVPDDLQLLAHAGVTVHGIRKLMGLASRAGVRLADVVAAAGSHIARARKAYCYVLKLLRSGKDWASLARAPAPSELAKIGEEGTGSEERARRFSQEVQGWLGSDGWAVSRRTGVVYAVREGQLEESTLSALASPGDGRLRWMGALNWPSDGQCQVTVRNIRKWLDEGDLEVMPPEAAMGLARGERVLVEQLQQACAGKVMRGQGAAWRFKLGQLEQTELRVVTSRRGTVSLPWAAQLARGFDLRLARAWRDQQLEIVDEQQLLDAAQTAETPRKQPWLFSAGSPRERGAPVAVGALLGGLATTACSM